MSTIYSTTPTYSSNTMYGSSSTVPINISGATYTLAAPTTTNVTAWTNTIDGSNKLKVNGNAEIDGTLSVQGKDIIKLLTNIEERLAILHPNPELESRWEELKELSKRYKELERELLEKEQVWKILKK